MPGRRGSARHSCWAAAVARVLVCDVGEPRNARSSGLHDYLTRDGIPPARISPAGPGGGRSSIPRWSSAAAMVVRRGAQPVGVHGGLRGRHSAPARKLLLATGVVDELPEIEGLAAALRHQRPPLPLL